MGLIWIKKGIIVLFTLVVIGVYYFFDPGKTSMGPACIFKTVTGWSCWGCGGQRAFHHLLHGHWQKAFDLNALVFPVILLFIYIFIVEITQRNPSYPLIRIRRVSLSILLMVITFTIFRNL